MQLGGGGASLAFCLPSRVNIRTGWTARGNRVLK